MQWFSFVAYFYVKAYLCLFRPVITHNLTCYSINVECKSGKYRKCLRNLSRPNAFIRSNTCLLKRKKRYIMWPSCRHHMVYILVMWYLCMCSQLALSHSHEFIGLYKFPTCWYLCPLKRTCGRYISSSG